MPGVFPKNNFVFSNQTKFSIKDYLNDAKLVSSSNNNGRLILSCAKTYETIVIAKSEGELCLGFHQYLGANPFLIFIFYLVIALHDKFRFFLAY